MNVTVWICDTCKIWFETDAKSRGHYIARGHPQRIEIVTLNREAANG